MLAGNNGGNMKLRSMPNATAAALLAFLAEEEQFTVVARKLKSSIAVEEVRALLRELAQNLHQGVSGDANDLVELLNPDTRNAVAALSAAERELLFTSLGLEAEAE